MKTEVKLTDELLLTLDGKGDEELQKHVDDAKLRKESESLFSDLTPKQNRFLVKLRREAVESGKLIQRYCPVRFCDVCGKSGGYVKYKSGRNKGRDNWDKPINLSGFEFADRFVVMRGYPSVGCCQDCFTELKPYIAESLKDVKAQIPESITGAPSGYKWAKNMHCKQCGWEGPETEMGHLRAIFNGTYPGECPKCKAQNAPLGKSIIETMKGFSIIPTTTNPA